MFWGLIMEPGRCYTQTVKVSFHVSMAALDILNSSDDPAQVMCVFEGRNYLLCTLNKKDKLQCSLDLNFEVGSKVSFATNGKSHVHLTGYLTGLDDELEEEEAEEEESVVISKKEKKRLKKQLNEGPPKKKSKSSENDTQLNNSKEDVKEESSDSDFDLDKLVKNEDSEEEEDEDEAEEEEDDFEDEEEEASSLSEPESEEEQTKPKQNGVAKASSTPVNKEQQKKGLEEKPKKQKETKEQKIPKEKSKKQEQKQPQGKKTTLKGGVVIQELKEGSGEVVKSGKFAHVYYEGRLKETNKVFDSTTKGPGFSFRVGKGEVIKGWDIGLVGMKVGGKRRIICPPNTAYGPKGSPPVIPPNSTLVFDVEIKKVS
ncbi:FKBP C domain containing protein [Asbolus verrucosus]|uniref:FK506-binding protein n=1 Tax=Asbolus verrucosus TaxID=1661398 RepID=A0A482VKP8_ASBVE|nr:FKBP C domain containing protein [Asbolus verrucosus]